MPTRIEPSIPKSNGGDRTPVVCMERADDLNHATLTQLRAAAKQQPGIGEAKASREADGGGIEARTLGAGLELLQQLTSSDAQSHVEQLSDQISFGLKHAQQTGTVPSTQHSKIQKALASIEKCALQDDEARIRDFAVTCIESSLRKNAWKAEESGAYGVSGRHPLDRIMLDERNAWLAGYESEAWARMMKQKNADRRHDEPLGVPMARAACITLGDQLRASNFKADASLYLDQFDSIPKMRLRAMDSESRIVYPGIKAPLAPEREAFAKLLKLAGATDKTINDVKTRRILKPADALADIESVVGAPAFETIEGARRHAGIEVYFTRDSCLGFGAIGRVQRATWNGQAVAHKSPHEPLKVQPDYIFFPGKKSKIRPDFSRGSGADTAYARGMPHVIVPSAFIAKEKSRISNNIRTVYRPVPREKLRDYLCDQKFAAVSTGAPRAIAFVENVQPLVNGRRLGKKPAECGMRALDQNGRDALVRQGLELLMEMGERGFVHTDIKPDNLMIDATGTLKLIDTDMIRKQHAGTLQPGGCARAYTLSTSIPQLLHAAKKSNPDGVDASIARAQDYFGVAISLLVDELNQIDKDRTSKLLTAINEFNLVAKRYEVNCTNVKDLASNIKEAFKITITNIETQYRKSNRGRELPSQTTNRINFLVGLATRALDIDPAPDAGHSSRSARAAAIDTIIDDLLQEPNFSNFRPGRHAPQ